MRKKKTISTTIVEKFRYDDYGISIEPALLIKLLEFAHEEAKTDEQLHSIVSRAHAIAYDHGCLKMDHYYKLITDPTTPVEPTPIEVLEEPTEPVMENSI